jgi:hypothetical protein
LGAGTAGVGIVEVAGIEGRVEGGGGEPVEHHIAHRQQRGIADQEHIAGVSPLPGGIQESLELLGISGSSTPGDSSRTFSRMATSTGRLRRRCSTKGLTAASRLRGTTTTTPRRTIGGAFRAGARPRAAQGRAAKRRITPKRNREAMVMAIILCAV